MALPKTFVAGQPLSAADVNDHLVNRVPNAGDAFDTSWLEIGGASGETVRCRRVGMVVTVHVTDASAPSGNLANVNAGNPILPVGMRPYVFAEGGARGDVPGTSTLPCTIEVTPEGVVRFYKPSNVTEYLFGSVTYVVA